MMFRAGWRASRRLRFRSTNTKSSFTSRIAGLSIAATTAIWSLSTTLLDDGNKFSLFPRLSQKHAPDAKLQKAWQNAKADPTRARAATFAFAEDFITTTGCDSKLIGDFEPRKDALYVLKRMGISKHDIRLWAPVDPSGTDQDRGLYYLAVNADPSDINNHMILIATLQFEFDRLRETGRLPAPGFAMAVIQMREEIISLVLEPDGRFTPVIQRPFERAVSPMAPLDRLRIEIQEDGMPLLIAESLAGVIQDSDRSR